MVFIHNSLIQTAKINSNRCARKSRITIRISIISKNSYDFLVDTNDHYKEINKIPILVKIRKFINSVFNSNSYIIYEENKGIIIDIGDFEPVINFIKKHNLNIQALFITHTHYDHIYGIKEFIFEFPNTPIYTSAFGHEALKKSNLNLSRYHNDPIEIDSPYIFILNGDEQMFISGIKIEVIACPGHDKSCLSFKINNNLFTGDSYIPNNKVIATFPNSDKSMAKLWLSLIHISEPTRH